MVFISAILTALSFAVTKKYETFEGGGLASGLKFNVYGGLFITVIFFIFTGFKLQFSVFSLIMSAGISLFAILYTLISFKILRKGNMAIFSLFLMSGGMLAPYIYGILFLDESVSVLRVLGIAVILGAMVLSNISKDTVKSVPIFLCISVFLLNGLVSIFSKVHQISTTFETVDTMSFVMYNGITKSIISAVALIFCKDEIKKFTLSAKKSFIITILFAAVTGFSSMLMFAGAVTLPATVLYPITSGGTIIFSAIFGKIFYKETVSTKQWISVFLCFAGTLMFL